MRLCILFGFLSLGIAAACAQSTAFTYQGRLTTDNAPANGRFDFEFSLFSAESGGTPVNGPLAQAGVGVTNGLFTVPLDFGASAFAGQPRWLGITVRPTGVGIITPLHPRQPITSAPYAVTALNAFTAMSVPGLDGYSLDSSDRSVTDAVYVDGGGEVGIGTTVPAARLHIVSAPGDVAPPRLESKGSDRFSAGWDFYHIGVGKGYVGVPDANAGIAPGELVLFGGPGIKTSLWASQARALTADTTGNVGIGTDTPAAKLDVRGDIRMGSSGQLRATSGEENLRIIRGVVAADGTILQGAGFTVSRVQLGRYRITFSTPFAAPPALTASGEDVGPTTVAQYQGVAADSGMVFVLQHDSGSFLYFDGPFSFTAIGPR